MDEVFAFPTAYGAAAEITGGRGGQVVHVTNLNNSGPGSLRAAIQQNFPRIIVFDVSGVINLTSILPIGQGSSNFTIAGQTAPEGGITITGKTIQIGWGDFCNNIIIRYIRFRNGSYTGVADVYDHNGITSTGAVGLIIDHCSFSFCDDQAISLNARYGDLRNITVQNSIFSENATQIIIGHDLTNITDNISVIGNLFTDTSHRTPNIGGRGSKRVDIINNVMVNYRDRLSNLNHTPDSRVNNIGNYYKRGSYSGSRHNVVQRYTGMMDTPSIYSAYNYDSVLYPTPVEGDNNLWTDFMNYGQAIDSSFFTSTSFALIGRDLVIKSAVQAFNDVQNNIGANKYLNADGTFGIYYDTYDETKISNIGDNIYLNPENKVWVQPVLPNNSRASNFYGTNQHIPQAFLTARGVTNTTTVHNDIAPSGYTWLEEYLNQVDDVEIIITPIITRTDSNPTTIIQGGTYIPPTGIWTDEIDGTGVATVIGTVDTNVLGIQTVRLQHTNTSENTGYLDVVYTIIADNGNVLYPLSSEQRSQGNLQIQKLIKSGMI